MNSKNIEMGGGVQTYYNAVDGKKSLSLNGRETNFVVSEFACKDGTDAILIDRELVDRLQRIRDRFGAVRINSAYRTAAHNARVGGVKGSQHLFGKAADIVALQVSRLMPLTIAIYADIIGCGGIFSYADFCHVDTRSGIVRGDYSGKGYAQGGTFLRTLRYGSQGDHVRIVQGVLGLRVDGIFGQNTLSAIYQFQREHHLDVDGIVGRKTWTALMA